MLKFLVGSPAATAATELDVYTKLFTDVSLDAEFRRDVTPATV